MNVTEIELALSQLQAKDFAELMTWLQEHYDRAWDRQIEEDLASGHLDALIATAEDEYRQGLSMPSVTRRLALRR